MCPACMEGMKHECGKCGGEMSLRDKIMALLMEDAANEETGESGPPDDEMAEGEGKMMPKKPGSPPTMDAKKKMHKIMVEVA